MTTYLAATRDRFLLGLKYADYRTMWIATTCSGAAAWALIVIRGYLAWELTDASLWVGIITFAAMFPRVFSTPFVGYLADRFDRQMLLRWIFALNFAHNILLGFLVMNGMAGPWMLTFLALFNGTLRAGQMTVSQALIPNLVPREHLLNALALNQATQQGSRLFGPLLILPLLYFVNIEAAFWFCSVFYFHRIRPDDEGAHPIDGSDRLLAGILEQPDRRVRVHIHEPQAPGTGAAGGGPLRVHHVLRIDPACHLRN